METDKVPYRKDLPKNQEQAKEWGDKLSKAKKFNILYKKVEAKGKIAKILGKKVQELSDFKEPVAILGRRNGHWEFYEEATQGWFFYEHSDGRKKAIYLDGRPDYMDYAKKSFRMYIIHEDVAMKLPENPITSADFIIDMETKMQSDRLKLEHSASKIKWDGIVKLIKMLGYVIGGLIALFMVANLMGIDVNNIIPWGKETTTVVVNNITQTKPIL